MKLNEAEALLHAPISSLLREAKRRLPLPELMQLLGFGGHVKKSARCPFHDDQRHSFSIFRDQRERWRWKCHAGCGWGDEITFLELHLSIPEAAAIRHYLDMAGVNGYGRHRVHKDKGTQSSEYANRFATYPCSFAS
jgi:hypothetical protein